MVKFSGSDKTSGSPVLGIGLSRENCEKILDNQMILFNTQNMPGLPQLEVCVFGGETEEDMEKTLLLTGVLTPEQIVEDKTLGGVRPADYDEGVN